jgi:hypothetical protein
MTKTIRNKKKIIAGNPIIILKRRDYVSELRPPTVVLFILYVICEHGEAWWNDIDRGGA